MLTGYSEDNFLTETSDMAFDLESAVTEKYVDAKKNHLLAL
jgi:hypothetical protein